MHHDNLRPYVAHSIVKFLGRHGVKTALHPQNSPDLGLRDFWLFPEVKFPLKAMAKMESKFEKEHVDCKE